MIAHMFGKLGAFVGNSGRAWLGAALLHVFALLIVLTATVKPLPPEPREFVSIEIVEVPKETIEEIAEPDIQTPDPVAPVEPPNPEPAPIEEPEIIVEQVAPETPTPPPPTVIAVAPPPSAPADPIEPDDEEAQDTIPPQYLIRRDPLLEVAPSGAARVSASVMCARTNRETRPSFCPDIDDEDIRFAQLARAQGDLGSYSPRDETLFARSTLNRFATSGGYQRFHERQQSLDEFASTGASPVRQLGVQTRRHAEGLENCTPVRTGIARVGGGTDGLTTELSNGSEVFCD
jgi:hypothetical protein